MNELTQQVAAGLVNGCLYAMLALALVMIYRATNHVNFAQGEMALLSTYVAAALIHAGLPYWVAAFAAIAFGFLSGALVERVLLRPLHNAPILAVVTVFIALMITISAVIGLVFGHHSETFPSPFAVLEGLGQGSLSPHAIGTIAVTVLVLAGMTVFFKTTNLGLAMRAVAMQPLSSELSGINVRRILMMGWGLAGVIGAIAGLLAAPIVFLEPHMMSGIMIYGFAAAVLGGVDSPVGAIVGGLAIGVGENLLGAFVTGNELKLTIALVAMFSILVLRPQGLFGSRIIRRV
ncbi:branched-chain amino acid ABC transporter permease [Pigmentiphaga sp. NML080357]|uniref:branched-chain amino acid ABC transporter permease n=1 Tax=Pigmentiphaga sp. NML080357 TaxID=2008675 RepID=UPI000B40DDA3|nr:branched-chain amino acid ABC transporter permease [Pigmentiphaga sp. NML080357]OVZ55076.1 branched-chain amino acid ABC transporter permease [Pigmentiphaga sp. NML080357]